MRNSTFAAAAFVALTGLGPLTACGSDDSTAADTETTPAASTTTPSAPVSSASVEAPVESSTAPPTVDEDALITLAAPASGATVSGSFDVKGTANSPEANVPWSLRDSADKVVAQGAFTAEGWMDKLYPYNGTVDLTGIAPGAYTFEVRVDDDSDGEGSSAGQAVGVPITVQ